MSPRLMIHAGHGAPRRTADPQASASPSSAVEPWLLLVHQLPPRPVGVRVRVWRRLRELGAVAVKNSVYALPNQHDAREDFEWVRAEIAAAGGQATVFQASTIDTLTGDELREAFRRDRGADYRTLTREAEKLTRQATQKRRPSRLAFERAVRGVRERLTRIERIDYFGAPGREEARAALATLEATSGGRPAATAPRPTLEAAAYRGRTWVTRPRPGIDRMASAWLIRRFVDPEARFDFRETQTPRTPGDVTFDTFEGDFTHDGDRCTFEVLCVRFGLVDASLPYLGELVHDLDLKDGRFGRSEAIVLEALVEGLRRLYDEDHDLLTQGIALFEALYRGQGPIAPSGPPRPPAPRRRSRARGH